MVPRAKVGYIARMHSFKNGDTVQLTEEAARKSKFPQRRGKVVGLGKPCTQIRVHWDQLSRPEVIHYTMLQHADARPKLESRASY